jgi:hypothetical protein
VWVETSTIWTSTGRQPPSDALVIGRHIFFDRTEEPMETIKAAGYLHVIATEDDQ